MVKELGIPTFFYADPKWEELPYIINSFNNLGLSDKDLKHLSYQE